MSKMQIPRLAAPELLFAIVIFVKYMRRLLGGTAVLHLPTHKCKSRQQY